ncbi:MAG TPA: maleylpyruvate isomerase N-terminal domain-containing protein, partial [Acidimicrobiales bacterium]|nr:maleylpyruvate isomerase N-terminal domain-containing protein [Acidimicrobiales bacterium]
MPAPGMVAASSAGALTAQLDEVWSELESLGRSLSDAEWSLPTPCPGWPVSAQYAHVIGTESMLLGRSRPAGASPASSAGASPASSAGASP